MAKFFGSRCTKDCGGHKAGYRYAMDGGAKPSNTSPSFNKGMRIAQKQSSPPPTPKLRRNRR
jgi:hypothetical protein